MKVSWCITPDMDFGDPARILIKAENNQETAALKALVEKFGCEFPRECGPQPNPYDPLPGDEWKELL